MTLRNFKEKIETYPSDTMNFCIEDVFSWRGIYAEPCCSLSTRCVTKEHNLKKLNRLLSETFRGLQGGQYRYDMFHTIHFENEYDEWTNGDYIVKFIVHNLNDEIKHIFG